MFTDNKAFVLKTLKVSERSLLFDKSVLENYYMYMISHQKSFLSRFYGVFTIKMEDMGEVTCCIMNNLVGTDFLNTMRIYDLKGSTVNRKSKLSKEQLA